VAAALPGRLLGASYMKKAILLLSAAYLNGGAYVDAGATVEIGDEKHQITDERAVDIENGMRGEIHEVEEAEEDDVEGDELEKLKVPELKDLATKEEVDLGEATTKAAIIAAIRAHRG
jgi:hypothetical protein